MSWSLGGSGNRRGLRAGAIAIFHTNLGGQMLIGLDAGRNAYPNDRLLVAGNVPLNDAGDEMTCVALKVG
jgi:hypothetical protein